MAIDILNKRSNEITEDGSPKLPSPEELKYGQIAINYAKGKETIAIKNDQDEVVSINSGIKGVKVGSNTTNESVANGIVTIANASSDRDGAITSRMYRNFDTKCLISDVQTNVNDESVAVQITGFYADKATGKYLYATINKATSSSAGVMTALDKIKLDSIINTGDGTKFLADNFTYKSIAATDIPDLSNKYLPLSGGTMTGPINITWEGIKTNQGTNRLLFYNDNEFWIGANAFRTVLETSNNDVLHRKNDTNYVMYDESNFKAGVQYIAPGEIQISEVNGLQTALDNKVSSSALNEYLPLSGGMMTGNVRFSNNSSVYLNSGSAIISYFGNDSYPILYGDSENNRTVLGTVSKATQIRSNSSITRREGNGSEYTVYDSGNFVAGTNYVAPNTVYTKSEIDSKGYQTASQVQTAISNLVDSAPETLNTLNELAAALGDDPNFATTVSNQIGNKADKNHTHTASQVSGLATVATSGSYNDLSNKPTIPSLSGYATQTWANDQFYPLNGKGYMSFDSSGRPVMINNQGYMCKGNGGSDFEIAYVNTEDSLVLGGTIDTHVGQITFMTDTLKTNSGKTVAFTSDIPSLSGYATQSWVNSQGFLTSVPAQSWGSITGKPSTFTPSAHNQASNTITTLTGYTEGSSTTTLTATMSLNTALASLQNQIQTKQAAGSYASSSHTHNYAGSNSAGGPANTVLDAGGGADPIALGYGGDSLTASNAGYLVAVKKDLVNGNRLFKDISASEARTFIGAAASSHTHTASQVSGLATVATSGSYNDLSNKPTIPSLSGYATQTWANGQFYPLNGKGYMTFDTNGRPVMDNNQGYSCKKADGTAIEVLWINPSNTLLVGGTSSSSLGTIQFQTDNLVTKSGKRVAFTSDIPTIPTLSGGASATSGQYVSGVTVSGHTVTVTKASLPTVTLSSLGVTATAAELNKLDGCTVTTTELNYVDGVTSNIQTQLNGKAASSHTHSNYATTSSVSSAISEASYNTGHNTATSLSNVAVTKRLVIATISSSQSFSCGAVADGRELHVIVRNSSSSNITITLPTSSPYINLVGDSLTVKGSSYAEINVVSDGSSRYIRAI